MATFKLATFNTSVLGQTGTILSQRSTTFTFWIKAESTFFQRYLNVVCLQVEFFVSIKTNLYINSFLRQSTLSVAAGSVNSSLAAGLC